MKVKWNKNPDWEGELYVNVAGARLFVVDNAFDTKWDSEACVGIAARSGRGWPTIAAAKADAIRLGRELAEDTLRAAMEMAEAWGVEYVD